MPSDLIYREDAKDFVRHAYHKGLNPVEYLDEVPAADVRPVVMGKWTRVDYKPCGHDYICSECGCKSDGAWNFCYNCGADMRKVVEVEQVKEIGNG